MVWININIVAYRPVAKQWICKHRPLLDNARNIHAANSTGTLFSMYADGPLLRNARAVTSQNSTG
jgi:hypothetical protein